MISRNLESINEFRPVSAASLELDPLDLIVSSINLIQSKMLLIGLSSLPCPSGQIANLILRSDVQLVIPIVLHKH